MFNDYWNVKYLAKEKLYYWGFPYGIYVHRCNTNDVKEYLKQKIKYFSEVRDKVKELAIMSKILTT